VTERNHAQLPLPHFADRTKPPSATGRTGSSRIRWARPRGFAGEVRIGPVTATTGEAILVDRASAGLDVGDAGATVLLAHTARPLPPRFTPP
jgi:hypothetical protein